MALSIAITIIATLPQIGVEIWFVTALLSSIMLLFSTMTITIKDQEIQWYFGPGFWKKKLPLTQIRQVSVEKAQWYHGFGIRLRLNGWMYRVSGASLVVLELENGTTVSLGTNDSAHLVRAIEEKLSQPTVESALINE